jgi:hypothetical protein
MKVEQRSFLISPTTAQPRALQAISSEKTVVLAVLGFLRLALP